MKHCLLYVFDKTSAENGEFHSIVKFMERVQLKPARDDDGFKISDKETEAFKIRQVRGCSSLLQKQALDQVIESSLNLTVPELSESSKPIEQQLNDD